MKIDSQDLGSVYQKKGNSTLTAHARNTNSGLRLNVQHVSPTMLNRKLCTGMFEWAMSQKTVTAQTQR
jgi:hypothetical protein